MHRRCRAPRSSSIPGARAALPLAFALALGTAAAAAAQEGATESAFGRLSESAGLKATGAFPFDYQHLAFRAGRGDSVDLWSAASVHAGRVRGVWQGGWRYSLGIRLELYDGEELVATSSSRSDHTLSRHVPPTTSDGFPLQTVVRVEPGEYRYRLRVTDFNWPDDRSVNEKSGTVTVPPFDVSGPVVSSIAIAADSGGTWTPAPDVELKLNAARIVRPTARPYIYFEVYGLTPGASYRGEVRLVSTWASRGKGEDFRGEYRPFQLQYRGTTPENPAEPVRSTLRLDLSRTEAGPYDVTVKVTDLSTGESSTTRRAHLKVQSPGEMRPIVPVREVNPGSSRR
ncbi:MAG: hypothetical protein ACE5HF_10260 [Gemmatimonadota bacterium]